MSRRNRERREQNRRRRVAGEVRVKEVQADALFAALLRQQGREKVAAQLEASTTDDEDIARAYADSTAQTYLTPDEASRKALRRATYRAALVALQANEG